jgi:intracellular multiplication protein IcmL
MPPVAQDSGTIELMQNQHAAIMRRLSDPDFQASLVTRCIGLVIGMGVVLAGFAAHDAYVWTHPPQPKYFFIDGQHPPRPVTALDSPIVDDTELLDWTVKSVLAPYNVNYHDYPVQLNTAGRHFTQAGWNTFANSYITNGNFAELQKAMLLCYAEAQRAAIIRRSLVIAGALAYEVQFPIVQTCQNTQQASTQNLMMTATVVRTNDDNHPDGLAIDQLVAAPR